MRSLREIEKSVAKASLHSDDAANQKVLNDLLTELDQVQQGAPNGFRSKWSESIGRRRLVKLAAAAAILVIAALLIDHHVRPETVRPGSELGTEARVETVNAIGLSLAYRRGGMEAVEQQYLKTFKNSKSRPTRLSVEELLTELTENGDS